MKELRCPSALAGKVLENGLIEVSCKSKFCGKEPGIVVLHRFHAETGELVETLKYKAPHKKTQDERTA